MFKQILVPIGDQGAGEAAARHAFDLTRVLGGRVTLLRVLEEDTTDHLETAERQLEALALGARRSPVRVVLAGGHDILGTVAGFAAKSGVDLIVLSVSADGSPANDGLGLLAPRLAAVSGVPVHLAVGRRRFDGMVPAPWQQLLVSATDTSGSGESVFPEGGG